MHRDLGSAALSEPGPTMARVLDEREAARQLNIGPRLLRRMRAEGRGPVFVQMSGRSIGYLPADLDAWLHACRRESRDRQESVA